MSSLSCATSSPCPVANWQSICYLLDASYGLLQRNMRQSKTNPRTKPAVVGIESMAAASAGGWRLGKQGNFVGVVVFMVRDGPTGRRSTRKCCRGLKQIKARGQVGLSCH